MVKRAPYVWDYDIDDAQFKAMLAGELALGRLDRDWAAVRLLEYASYADIVELLGFDDFAKGWPRWRDRIRSHSRQRGFDFLANWLAQNRRQLS